MRAAWVVFQLFGLTYFWFLIGATWYRHGPSDDWFDRTVLRWSGVLLIFAGAVYMWADLLRQPL